MPRPRHIYAPNEITSGSCGPRYLSVSSPTAPSGQKHSFDRVRSFVSKETPGGIAKARQCTLSKELIEELSNSSSVKHLRRISLIDHVDPMDVSLGLDRGDDHDGA